MSTSALKWAARQKLRSGVTKSLLLALADYANKAGECWPSQATLAAQTGYSKRSIEYALKALEDCGLISRKKRGSNKNKGGRSSDLVTLAIGASQSSELPLIEGSIYRKKSAVKSGGSYSQNSATKSAASYSQKTATKLEGELVADVCEGLRCIYTLGRKEAKPGDRISLRSELQNSSDSRKRERGHVAAAQATHARAFRSSLKNRAGTAPTHETGAVS